LKDLGQYINVYQTGTTATMKDLAAGTVDMIASTTGWYINPIILGTVPKTTAVGQLPEHDLGDRRAVRRDPEGRLAPTPSPPTWTSSPGCSSPISRPSPTTRATSIRARP
jgi:hypothetical protein